MDTRCQLTGRIAFICCLCPLLHQYPYKIVEFHCAKFGPRVSADHEGYMQLLLCLMLVLLLCILEQPYVFVEHLCYCALSFSTPS